VWKKQPNNHFSSYVQAEARLLVVGVMGKILNSDSRGVSATLLERMKEATTQLLEFPPCEELLGQYSSQGYRYDDDPSFEISALVCRVGFC
jgi:hypothetical protein